ncbi:MAG: hypothetical protein OES38_08405 [Gammaproteobacteria bacterium]|nr:hypothetical protein [Gammaproteobacteria bacterium]
MIIALRIVGIFLLILAMFNLVALAFIDTGMLISPVAVTVRYSLMALAGIGFVLIRKWGAIVYLVSLTINWVSYYTLYEGQGSLGPLWLAIPLPLGICILIYFAWGRLR